MSYSWRRAWPGLLLFLLILIAWIPFLSLLGWLHHLHFPILFWRHSA